MGRLVGSPKEKRPNASNHVSNVTHRHPRTIIRGMQKHLGWPVGYSGMGVWGATPEPKQYFLALCSANTTILGIQEHLCWPKGYSGRGAWGATPDPKQYFLALCSSNTPIPGIQKHLCWPVGYSGMGVSGATPEPKQYIFGTVQFKHHHQRNSKTPLLANGVQWCGCLERHP